MDRQTDQTVGLSQPQHGSLAARDATGWENLAGHPPARITLFARPPIRALAGLVSELRADLKHQKVHPKDDDKQHEFQRPKINPSNVRQKKVSPAFPGRRQPRILPERR